MKNVNQDWMDVKGTFYATLFNFGDKGMIDFPLRFAYIKSP